MWFWLVTWYNINVYIYATFVHVLHVVFCLWLILVSMCPVLILAVLQNIRSLHEHERSLIDHGPHDFHGIPKLLGVTNIPMFAACNLSLVPPFSWLGFITIYIYKYIYIYIYIYKYIYIYIYIYRYMYRTHVFYGELFASTVSRVTMGNPSYPIVLTSFSPSTTADDCLKLKTLLGGSSHES